MSGGEYLYSFLNSDIYAARACLTQNILIVLLLVSPQERTLPVPWHQQRGRAEGGQDFWPGVPQPHQEPEEAKVI